MRFIGDFHIHSHFLLATSKELRPGFLDKYTLIANSIAHSPEKLGRNANILDTDLPATGS